MKSLERRIERLERLGRGRKQVGMVLIIVVPGETKEEAWRKHLAKYPENEKADTVLYISRPPPRLPDPKGEGNSQQSPRSDGQIPEKHQPGTRIVR